MGFLSGCSKQASVDEKIYFGEFTNYSYSGRGFIPKSFDFELGSNWKLVPDYWKKRKLQIPALANNKTSD